MTTYSSSFASTNKGSRIRLHVDLTYTEKTMIGTVIQIDQDMRGAPDWEFQAIGPDDGVSHMFNNTPGDILMFEPSLVPHGRPDVLQGESFVNAFIFYYVESREARNDGKDEL